MWGQRMKHKMYIPLESADRAAPQHHSVQDAETEVDGSQVLVIGGSLGPPAIGRKEPPLPMGPGSDCHTVTDRWTSRSLTLLPVQETLKNIFPVFSICHKQLSVLKQMNLSSNFSSVSTRSWKIPEPSIFHLEQVQRVCSECHYFRFFVLLFFLHIRFLAKVPAVFSYPFSVVLQ